MMKQSFFNRSQTAVTALLRPYSINDAIAQSRTAEFERADAIAIELGNVPLEERTKENFQRLISEVKLPFMFILYRNDLYHGADDEARQKYLLAAANAGAEVIDVMGDLFAPAPYELTFDDEAVKKQKDLIREIHSRGAKVIMSSHMSEARSAEDVLSHLQEQESRGADIVKIVTGVNSDDELLEAIRTTMLLNKTLKIPFVHLCGGTHNRIHRFMGPQLGVAVTFGVTNYYADALMMQPTIRSFKEVMDNINWRI